MISESEIDLPQAPFRSRADEIFLNVEIDAFCAVNERLTPNADQSFFQIGHSWL